MLRFSEIIGRWPTVAEFANDVGAEAGTARKWRSRDVLPPAVWLRTVRAARERRLRGVTLRRLATIAERQAAA